MKREVAVLGVALLALITGTPAHTQSPPEQHGSEATALVEYERTGKPPVIRRGNLVLHPFGHGMPTLSCAPLRACRIELQDGEKLLAEPALGDTERWLTAKIAAGPDGATPVVLVKPKDCGLATNLVISTNRRIYDLDLDAGACGRAPARAAAYTRSVRFYYPDDHRAASAGQRLPASTAMPEATARNSNYRWKRRNGFPWEPTRIFDDGVHVYVQLPPEARHDVAPVLYLVDDGGYSVLNYTTRGDTYVTDRVFHRAALVIGEGSGKQERRLLIERYANPRRPSLRRVAPLVGGAAAVGVLTALMIGG
jgi:type IV secretion system protein VirB9